MNGNERCARWSWFFKRSEYLVPCLAGIIGTSRREGDESFRDVFGNNLVISMSGDIQDIENPTLPIPPLLHL